MTDNVLVRVSIAVMKTDEQNQVGKEMFYLAYPSTSESSTEGCWDRKLSRPGT